MNKKKRGDGKKPQGKPKSNSFGYLLQSAIRDRAEAAKAYDQLRTTYLKEVTLKDESKKQYWKIFPASVLRVEERPFTHQIEGERERIRDFRFSVNAQARNFVRNLWFAHQFFSKPAEVERFLSPSTVSERQKLFQRRSDELQTLANTYLRWSSTTEQIRRKLENFDPTESDLLLFLENVAGSSATTATSPFSAGSAAIADLIREVEHRASYKAGNPDDACEKALYFYALGRHDIGHAIAREVLDENPNHAVALYANAVFLLSASESHQRQAFIHDVMHPHDLDPIEAEEFHHVERHAEESLRAEEKANQAFLLMLRARQNWPEKFPIRCYELTPGMWLDKVDGWILRQAEGRLGADPKGLMLPEKEVKIAWDALRLIITQVWARRGRSLFIPDTDGFLRRFITVAAQVHPDLGRDCIAGLKSKLEDSKPRFSKLHWEYYSMDLPVSCDPSLAATLIPAVTNPRFAQAVFSLKSETDGVSFLARILQDGMRDERDRVVTIWSLKTRDAVLILARGKGLEEGLRICLEMAHRHDWPATETGGKLQCCWLYGAVLLIFESSRAAFEANDLVSAIRQAAHALQLANDSLAMIANDQPLLKCYEEDEDGVYESTGDFFHRQPNIITDANSSDYFPVRLNSFPFPGREKECWWDFAKWLDTGHADGKPVLLAYGLWLSEQHGQGAVLSPVCEVLAASLESLKKQGG